MLMSHGFEAPCSEGFPAPDAGCDRLQNLLPISRASRGDRLQTLQPIYLEHFPVSQDGHIGSWSILGGGRREIPPPDAGDERGPPAFVVHVGDIEHDPRGYKRGKTGALPCTDDTFAQRKALFHTSKHPFILTPGDNDWTDCHYAEPSPDPLERLAKLREVFFKGAKASASAPSR